MNNLFQIDAELFALHQEIEENGGELTLEREATLAITQEERAKKGEGYVYIQKQLKAQAELLRAEAKRLTERAKQYETSAEKLAERLIESIQAHGKIQTDLMTITTRKSKSVHITEESLLSEEFKRIKTEPNKTAIKEALERGESVEGATIVENYTLQIR
jgi:hypothetical protein